MRVIIFSIFTILGLSFGYGQAQKVPLTGGQVLAKEVRPIIVPMTQIEPSNIVSTNNGNGIESIVIGTGTVIDDSITATSLKGDNGIAVSNKAVLIDTVVSVKNARINYYTLAGNLIQSTRLDSFANPVLAGYSFGDPKILYDSDYDRYVFSYQAWDTPPNAKKSYIFIFASKSSNPMLGWNGYIIQDTDVVPDSLWLDRPDIGMSTEEIFINAHAFKDSVGGFRRNAIIALRKDKLYANQTDTLREVVIPNEPKLFGLFPVSFGQGGNYGPGIYMVRTHEIVGDSVWLYDITNHVYTHNFQILKKGVARAYYISSNPLLQKGTNVKLNPGTSRVLDAFYLNGIVHYVFTESKGTQNIKSRISYNRLNLNTNTNTSATYANLGAAYPSLASFATTSTDKSVVIGFLTSDSLSFPSFHAISCDDNMNWGNDLLLAAGDTARLSTGWGDYTGTVRKHNAPIPTAWAAGNYTDYIGVPWTSTYIAEIIKTGTTSIANSLSKPNTLKVYPNPTNTTFRVDFLDEHNAEIKIFLYDMIGHPIDLLYKGKSEHLATKYFNTNSYAKGTYIIYITNEHNQVINHEKIVVY